MTEPMSAERLAEIRARAEAATEGPWEAKSCGDTCCQWIERHDGEMLPRTDTYFDARFIAHARTDVPDLLIEIDRLRALTGVEVDPDYPDSPGGYCRNCSQWVPDREALIHLEDAMSEQTDGGPLHPDAGPGTLLAPATAAPEPERLTDPDDPRIKPGARMERIHPFVVMRANNGYGPEDVRKWICAGTPIRLLAEAPDPDADVCEALERAGRTYAWGDIDKRALIEQVRSVGLDVVKRES